MNFRPIIDMNHNEEVVALVRAHTGADRVKAWAIFTAGYALIRVMVYTLTKSKIPNINRKMLR